MKKSKKLMLLGLSLATGAVAATSTVSSFAWFSMNTQVTAKGMNIRAQAEGGIVISNESGADWKATTTASHQDLADLAPISTANTTAWYHNKSEDAANAAAGQAAATYANYTSKIKVANGVGYYDADDNGKQDTGELGHYLLNKFYIKSSADQIKSATLYINKVKVDGTSTSEALDAALRVAIVIGGNTYIYAPVADATLTYTVAGATAVTAVAATGEGIVNTAASGVASIPNNSAVVDQTNSNPALEASVFIYFEGEDANCKSNNITTSLDALSVAVTFGTTTL